jgi:SnoaL-like polyketide cyclase
MVVTQHPVIRQYYEFYNERRFAEGAALFAPEAVLDHAPYGRLATRGPAGYLESAERSVVAFPDARIEVLGVEPHGDSMFDVDLVATGTHRGFLDLGTYGSFEATGVFVRVRHRELLEIRNGQIVLASVTLDVGDLVLQLTRGQK